MTDEVAELIDPQFWRMPLEDRMARFAELREIDAFLPASFDNPMSGIDRGVLGHDALCGARRDQSPARGLLLGTWGGVDSRPAGGGVGVLRVVHQHGCPAVLFPFAREVISDLIVKGGFPNFLLPLVNFDALFSQTQETAQPNLVN